MVFLQVCFQCCLIPSIKQCSSGCIRPIQTGFCSEAREGGGGGHRIFTDRDQPYTFWVSNLKHPFLLGTDRSYGILSGC